LTTYIWGRDEKGKGTWIKKPKNVSGRHHYVGNDMAPMYLRDSDTVINSKSDLREYEKRHNVSNDLDSLREQGARELARAGNIRPAGTRRERIALIRDEFERASSTGNNKDLNR
jgi:hypothetical protein